MASNRAPKSRITSRGSLPGHVRSAKNSMMPANERASNPSGTFSRMIRTRQQMGTNHQRNCRTQQRTVKIGDFGSQRSIEEVETYRAFIEAKPVKAPERDPGQH